MVTVNPRNSKPIYEQIVEQMKENILRGYIRGGDSIPSTRKLAMMVGVNPNTVARAYQELERQGLIETIQGKGTFAAGTRKVMRDEGKMSEIREGLKTLVIEMRYMGLTKEEIQDEVTALCEDLAVPEGEPARDCPERTDIPEENLAGLAARENCPRCSPMQPKGAGK